MVRSVGLGLLILMLLTGCGGGNSTPSSTATPGPAQLSAAYDPYQYMITLAWVRPAGYNVDGYNVEASINSGPFSKINPVLISGLVTSARLIFTAPPPELAVVDFRITALLNNVAGPYSNIAEIKLPVAPPTAVGANFYSSSGGIDVTWQSNSKIADHNVLERAQANANGVLTGPWTALPLSTPLATSFLDTTGQDGAIYFYRVTAWAGTTASPTTTASAPGSIPPHPPTSLAAQSMPGAVGLTWVNQSSQVTQINVYRSDRGLLTTLPPTATSYQDTNLSLGYYTYRLDVTNGRDVSSSPSICASPTNPSGAPILTAFAMNPGMLPMASALSSTGQWAFASQWPFGVPAVPWGPWPSWQPSSPWYVPQDCLGLDAQSLPHVVYQSQTSSGANLNHSWYDGSLWNTEVIQQLPSTAAALATAFCLDSNGHPAILQDVGPGGTLQGLSYSHQVSGAWVHESLQPTGTAVSYQRLSLSRDASGYPHVLAATFSSILEYSRNADGSWTSQPLPPLSSTRVYDNVYQVGGVWADPNTAWVLFSTVDPSNPSNIALWMVRKLNGTWQQPLTLQSRNVPGTGSIALSADGTRVAVAYSTTFGVFLYTPTSQGWLESLLPLQPGNSAPGYLKATFDSTDQLHVLVQPSYSDPSLVDFHE